MSKGRCSSALPQKRALRCMGLTRRKWRYRTIARRGSLLDPRFVGKRDVDKWSLARKFRMLRSLLAQVRLMNGITARPCDTALWLGGSLYIGAIRYRLQTSKGKGDNRARARHEYFQSGVESRWSPNLWKRGDSCDPVKLLSDRLRVLQA
jgi:hypothetical protein